MSSPAPSRDPSSSAHTSAGCPGPFDEGDEAGGGRDHDVTLAVTRLAELEAVEDPLARAAAATRLLAALDAERLELVRIRRAAVAATDVSVRALARALDLSVTAAGDLRRGADGRPRRSERDGRSPADPTPTDQAPVPDPVE